MYLVMLYHLFVFSWPAQVSEEREGALSGEQGSFVVRVEPVDVGAASDPCFSLNPSVQIWCHIKKGLKSKCLDQWSFQ